MKQPARWIPCCKRSPTFTKTKWTPRPRICWPCWSQSSSACWVFRRRYRHFVVYAAVLDDRQVGRLARIQFRGRSCVQNGCGRPHRRFGRQMKTTSRATPQSRAAKDAQEDRESITMQSMFDERQWLAWLAKARILILTCLLGIELAISRLTPSPLPLRLFIETFLLWYAVSVFHLLLFRFGTKSGCKASFRCSPIWYGLADRSCDRRRRQFVQFLISACDDCGLHPAAPTVGIR